MKSFIFLFPIFISCISNQTAPNRSYTDILSSIHTEQLKFKSISHDSAFYQACSNVLFTTLIDSVFPAWNGTTWHFYGTTDVPKEGTIACGYFVSTTLKHIGFNLNRFKLAQQASKIIVDEVCGKEHAKTIYSYDKVSKFLQNKKDGLFIVGLDNHVGFILIKDNISYFIHADYYHGIVLREEIQNSHSFQASNIFVIGELTNNKKLVQKWIHEEFIY